MQRREEGIHFLEVNEGGRGVPLFGFEMGISKRGDASKWRATRGVGGFPHLLASKREPSGGSPNSYHRNKWKCVVVAAPGGMPHGTMYSSTFSFMIKIFLSVLCCHYGLRYHISCFIA